MFAGINHIVFVLFFNLYVDERRYLSTNIKRYLLQVTSVEPSYRASASCLLRVVPPLGLTVLHPLSKNGTIYLQPNDTRLLLRVQSRYTTELSRHGSNHDVIFQPSCPPEFSSYPGRCQPGPSAGSGVEAAEPSLFAVLDLRLGVEEQSGPVQVELKAHNEVTEASLTVVVCLEEPLRGLVVQPHPTHRVLMESVVVSVFIVVCMCAVHFTGVGQLY